MKTAISTLALLFSVHIVSPTPIFTSRTARQTGATASSSSSASSSGAAGNFGIGAAAGIGGVGASSGIGSFAADTRTNPFLPFGAFAGINLPRSGYKERTRGRIGAGCSGLSCGFQFGDFVAQLPFVGHSDDGADDEYYDDERYPGRARYRSGFSNNYNPYNYNYNPYNNNFGAYGFQNQNYFPGFRPFQFPQMQFPQMQFPQFQFNPIVFPKIPNVADLSRINGGNVNGVYSSSGINVGPDGKVTTYQSGSGSRPTITTRYGKPGQVNGVYSSSSYNVGPDGKVTSYKDSGHF